MAATCCPARIDRHLTSLYWKINKRSLLPLHLPCFLHRVVLAEHSLCSLSLTKTLTDTPQAHLSQHRRIRGSLAVIFRHIRTRRPCFAWQKPSDNKSNLWNWQGPSTVSLVLLDHCEEMEEGKKDGTHLSNTNSNIYYDNMSREKERGQKVLWKKSIITRGLSN